MIVKTLKTNNRPIHVIIPAYEEEKNVGQIVRGLRDVGLDLRIWVIDDGSKDDTAQEAREAGGQVVRHCVNLGQWAALRTGFMLSLLNHADTIVTLDADGQHDPKDLPRLVEALDEQKADLVVSSRFLDEEEPEMLRHRRLGIRFLNRLLKVAFNCDLTDCTNGFKAYRADIVRNLLPELKEDQYGALEFLAKAASRRAKIMEVAVSSIHNDSSKKGNLRYFVNLVRTVAANL